MLRGRLIPSTLVAALGVLAVAGSVCAEPDVRGALHGIPLRGGLAGALAAIGDPAPADRSQFLLEVIRRVHDGPASSVEREALLTRLLAHLDRSATSAADDTLPLPLSPELWTSAVFGGRVQADALIAAILRSRDAALLYSALLSLDDATRAWLEDHPALLTELATRSAAFLVAAPGLRIAGGAVQVPGGDAAVPVWQAVVGKEPRDPAAFIRAIVAPAQAPLAYFFGSLAQLTAPQIAFALQLGAADPAVRVDAGRRLLSVYERLVAGWRIDHRPFWRPTLDPALLLADLRVDRDGVPVLPGTRAFWSAAMETRDDDRFTPLSAAETQSLATGEAAGFAWLCEQLFKGGQIAQRRPYEMALFASRTIGSIAPASVSDSLVVIRATANYGALITALERAGMSDVATFARTVRRASQLSAIDDQARLSRAVGQFQASVVLLTRAAQRQIITTDALSQLLVSLADVELTDRGEYQGRLVRWWKDVVARHISPASAMSGSATSSPGRGNESLVHPYADAVNELDADVIRLLAGPIAGGARFVDWEGTRYRLDFAFAEATRLARVLGAHPRPFLSSALALVEIAEGLADPSIARETLQQHATTAERVQELVAWPGLDRPVSALARAAAERGARGPQALAPMATAFRGFADELFARGGMEMVYAIALGQPDRAMISAADAASRHDFGLRLFGRMGPWRYPVSGADRMRDWHVNGSLFALDVKLADFSLVRVSNRPPPMRPTLNDADRRVLIEAVVLTEAAALEDGDRDAIVAAMRRGQSRLAAARTVADAGALADEIRLSAARRTLLGWVTAHDRERVDAFLSPTELLWLGLDRRPLDSRLNAWGAPGEPRLGCLCLRLLDPRPLDALAGRWDSGILASGFADLNLRLAEILAEMKMPAPLLSPVLAAATLELINTAVSRDQDDRRGLVEFVRTVAAERVELYLALLTSGGPLVAVGQAVESAGQETVRTREGAR